MKRRVGFLVKLSKDYGEEGYEIVEQKFVESNKIKGLQDISFELLVELFNSYFKSSDDISIVGESEINVSYFYEDNLKYYSYPALMIEVLSNKSRELNTYKVSADKVYCAHLGATAEESLFIDLDNYMFDKILNFKI